jgi:hypothetical protein
MTETDPTLPHQVVFFVPSGESRVHVSCNCRRNSQGGYGSMGVSHTIAVSRKLYNDPENHDKPFGEEDRSKW